MPDKKIEYQTERRSGINHVEKFDLNGAHPHCPIDGFDIAGLSRSMSGHICDALNAAYAEACNNTTAKIEMLTDQAKLEYMEDGYQQGKMDERNRWLKWLDKVVEVPNPDKEDATP